MAPPRLIHNLEVFTVDAAGAYEVAPTILQNGHHYNILKVKWIWNKSILGSSVARGGQRGAATPPIIANDEFCDSSKSVEKLRVSCIFLQHLLQCGLSML